MSRHETVNRLIQKCHKSEITITDISDFWLGDNIYSFDEIDRILNNKEPKTFLLRIVLDAPPEWLKSHPEEVCIPYGVSLTRDDILSLLKDDIRCSKEIREAQKPRTVRMSAFWSGPLPGIGTDESDRYTVLHQSISSRKWLNDACHALETLIEHIEKGENSEKVIGYIPVFGRENRNIWWDSMSPQGSLFTGDFGIANNARFTEWLKEISVTSASNSEALPQERWSINAPDDFQDFWGKCEDALPAIKPLFEVLKSCNSQLYATYLFRSKMTTEALSAFGKIICTTSEKISAVELINSVEPASAPGGNPSMSEIENSPYFDLIIAEPASYNSTSGEPGADGILPSSKAAFEKIHPVYTEEQMFYPSGEQDNDYCEFRDVCRCLSEGRHYLSHLSESKSDFYRSHADDNRIRSEVLIVEDEESGLYMAGLYGIHMGLEMRLDREIRLCGAAVDVCRIDRMYEMDLSGYRFIIFKKAFSLTYDIWERISSKISKGTTILWNYAAAYITGSTKQITGFSVCEKDRMQHETVYRHVKWHVSRPIPQDYPRLVIEPQEEIKILQTSPEGYVITASRQWNGYTSIYAADLTLRSEDLRKLMEEAGVHFDAPDGCAIYRTENMISFFAHDDVMIKPGFSGQWIQNKNIENVDEKMFLPLRCCEYAILEKIRKA